MNETTEPKSTEGGIPSDDLLGFILRGEAKPEDVCGWGYIRAGEVVKGLLTRIRELEAEIKELKPRQ